MIHRHILAKTRKHVLNYLYIGLFLLFTIPAGIALAAAKVDNLTITADQNEINVEIYRGSGDTIFIWHPHERGIQAIDKTFARQLAANGIEVWLTDLLEAYFLPNTASNMDRLPASGFAALIMEAKKTGKKIIVAASGRAAIPLLRGVRQWQLKQRDSGKLLGAVLLSPKLFIETPDPGLSGKFMPIVKATTIPVVILQPNKSPWFWKLGDTISALQTGGSEVFIWPLKGVRDRFYFRPDAFEQEKKLGENFYQKLLQSSSLLTRLPKTTRHAAELSNTAPEIRVGKKDRKLGLYKGEPTPPPLVLPDLNGKQFNLKSLKGKVVLVNFWASWCPPCVHEMPSMQRLAMYFQQKPFAIVAVNMAEDKDTINKFLNTRVSVTFPIIMDKDGTALKSWKVFAFPTSYVLDKKGNIRYALFGGVDWDSPDIKNKINQLINE